MTPPDGSVPSGATDDHTASSKEEEDQAQARAGEPGGLPHGREGLMHRDRKGRGGMWGSEGSGVGHLGAAWNQLTRP